MKTTITIILFLITINLSAQDKTTHYSKYDYTYYYYFSQEKVKEDSLVYLSCGVPYGHSHLIVGKDTLRITHTKYSPKWEVKYKDEQFVGYGLYEYLEYNNKSLYSYAHMKYFKRFLTK
jgi:hypothetical protein